MKIIFVGQKGLPAKSGGIETHVEALAQALVQRNHQVIVYTRPHYTPKKTVFFKGVRLISLPSLKTKHLDAASHSFLATWHIIFRQKDADIIHYHGIGPCLFLPLIRIFRPRLRVFATFHCRDYFHQKWSWFARLSLKLGEIFSVYFSHKTIVVSQELKRYIKNKYNRSVYYIPNGPSSFVKRAPSQKKQQSILNKWSLRSKEYFISVSRLVRHKGVHHLIRAYKRLPIQVRQEKKLVIVGAPAFTNDYFKELKTLAGKNPWIIFAGELGGDELYSVLKNAYLSIHPSESEGLSLALIEALTIGTPVLASNIPANKEVAHKLAYFFRNKNAKDLASKLSKILKISPDILNSKARLSQKKIAGSYNWQKIAIQTEKLYKISLSGQSRIPLATKIKNA